MKGQIMYKGYLIQKDTHGWIVKAEERPERFRTLHAAEAFVDRNPRR